MSIRSAIIGDVTAGELHAADPEKSAREFERIRPLYEKLRGVVVPDLNEALRKRGLDKQVHGGVVTSRVKEVDSFRNKTVDRKYADPLKETRDLLGVRIVCLYPSVLQDIDTMIRDTFTVVHYEDKGKGSEPEVWRYSSRHYDCTLPDSFSGRIYDDVKELVFEIQVRTILQDAWATVEHQLGYKTRKIPDELKREFSALAGLFHVADERFQFIANEVLRLERAQVLATELGSLYREVIDAKSSPGGHAEVVTGTDNRIKELESNPEAVINRGSVKALLRSMYPKRRRKRNPDYTLFAQDLNSAGIATLGALGKALISGDRAARESELESGPLTDAEFARRAVSNANSKFQSSRRQSPMRPPRSAAGEPRGAKDSTANFDDSAILRKAGQHLDDALFDLRMGGALTPFVIVDGPHGMMYESLPDLSDDDFWHTAGNEVPAIIVLYEAREMVLVTFVDDSEICGGRKCVSVAHWGPQGQSLSVAPVSLRYNKPPRIRSWRVSAASTERIDAVGDGFRHGTELAHQLRESSSSSDVDLLEQIKLIRITAGAEDDGARKKAVDALRRSRWLG